MFGLLFKAEVFEDPITRNDDFFEKVFSRARVSASERIFKPIRLRSKKGEFDFFECLFGGIDLIVESLFGTLVGAIAFEELVEIVLGLI